MSVAGIRGFPPISMPYARILILGSMPGQESLARQRYYAHPRNVFWPIMTDLFKLDGSSYQQITTQLARKGVAVWDVLQTCVRPGSLDSGIDENSIVTNDFQHFFVKHPDISRVFFNGAKAESIYTRRVLPGLSSPAADLGLQRLPSTSPALASMSIGQKKEAWSVILNYRLE